MRLEEDLPITSKAQIFRKTSHPGYATRNNSFVPEKLTCQRCKMGLLERALKICDDMGYKERPYFLPKKSSTL